MYKVKSSMYKRSHTFCLVCGFNDCSGHIETRRISNSIHVQLKVLPQITFFNQYFGLLTKSKFTKPFYSLIMHVHLNWEVCIQLSVCVWQMNTSQKGDVHVFSLTTILLVKKKRSSCKWQSLDLCFSDGLHKPLFCLRQHFWIGSTVCIHIRVLYIRYDVIVEHLQDTFVTLKSINSV